MSPIVDYPQVYNYRYSELSTWGPLPIISVLVIYRQGRRALQTDALLDTGAHFSHFDAEIALALGIALTGPTEKTRGLNGKVDTYSRNLELKFPPLREPVRCEIRFQVGLNKNGLPNLVGRTGVFNLLQIGFDEAQEKVYMARNP